MSDQITCPKCQHQFPLTEVLAAPLLESVKSDYEFRLAQLQAQRDHARTSLEQEVATRINQMAEQHNKEIQTLKESALRQAKADAAYDVKVRNEQIETLTASLKRQETLLDEARKQQALAVRKEMELAEERRDLELTVQKQIQQGLDRAKESARQEIAKDYEFRLLEREQTLESLQRKLEEAQKKASEGSGRLQGEAQEVALEGILKAKFPTDNITPVPKGEFGGDVVQDVVAQGIGATGRILWESKRTKTWSDGWLAKLRDDQRSAKADISILVTQTMPKDFPAFGLLDGVWVTNFELAPLVAHVLRLGLVDVSIARKSQEGQGTKMAMVYEYLTGSRFRQRVEAIVEAFSSMKEDLDKERKAITKQWAKREEQLERAMQGTVGMYGDLSGIAGSSFPELPSLSLQGLTI